MSKKFIKKILTGGVCFLYTVLSGKGLLLKKIIGILFVLGITHLPAFALDPLPGSGIELPPGAQLPSDLLNGVCPAGKVWRLYQQTGMEEPQDVCDVCYSGTYNEGSDLAANPPNSNMCHKCAELPNSGGHYKHTCATGVECHDSVHDCYATVTFRGKGGKYNNNTEYETLKVYYYNVTEALSSDEAKQCKLGSSSLCTLDGVTNTAAEGRGYKITDGVTNDTVWERDKYKFDGWYTDSNYTDKVTKDSVFRGDITLYAKWTCAPGYYSSNNDCKQCDEGYYCPGGNSGKIKCPNAFHRSNEGAKQETECYVRLRFDGNGATFGENPANTKLAFYIYNLGKGEKTCSKNSQNYCQLVTDKTYGLILTEETQKLFIKGEPFTKDDKAFGGWYYNNKKFNYNSILSDDVTLYAKWVCPQGSYKAGDSCTPCSDDNSKTTAGIGAESDKECKTVYKYKDGVWTWPAAVCSGADCP